MYIYSQIIYRKLTLRQLIQNSVRLGILVLRLACWITGCDKIHPPLQELLPQSGIEQHHSESLSPM